MTGRAISCSKTALCLLRRISESDQKYKDDISIRYNLGEIGHNNGKLFSNYMGHCVWIFKKKVSMITDVYLRHIW